MVLKRGSFSGKDKKCKKCKKCKKTVFQVTRSKFTSQQCSAIHLIYKINRNIHKHNVDALQLVKSSQLTLMFYFNLNDQINQFLNKSLDDIYEKLATLNFVFCYKFHVTIFLKSHKY